MNSSTYHSSRAPSTTLQTVTTLLVILLCVASFDVLRTLLHSPPPLPEVPRSVYADSLLVVSEFAATITSRVSFVESVISRFPLAAASTRRKPLATSRVPLSPSRQCAGAMRPIALIPAGVPASQLTAAVDTVLDKLLRSADKLRENMTFAVNSADKLVYQLHNFEPMKHRFSEPQWNDVPLAKQAAKSSERSILVGISSVNRKTNYLLATLRTFVVRLAAEDRRRVKIIVFNGNYPPSAHLEMPAVRSEFATELATGLLEIVDAPGPHPQLADDSKLALRWGDDLARVRWRSKQVLDVAFLMDHAQRHHGGFRYFLMMEDDIVAGYDYAGRLRRWVDEKLARRVDWMIASFYNPWEVQDLEELPPYKFFGVIGQLFRLHDLPVVVEFLRKNFDQSPLDWLFVDFLKKFNGKLVVHTPSLFQHQGTVSSLEGKEQSGRAVDFVERE